MFDQEKVREVTRNLIDNAIKYTEKGGIVVSSIFDPLKKIVTILVKDTGIGFDKEEKDFLFTKVYMSKRVCGIIIKTNNILLMRRIREGMEYFVFPGGGVENGESIENAMIREAKEELSLEIKLDKLLFQMENQGRQEFYFLIKEFFGTLQLGGEEKERMNKNNQYYPIWIDLDKALKLLNLYPEQAKERIKELIDKIK